MSKRLLILGLLLGACRNDAITFAHLLDPGATCQALGTSWGPGEDTAACTAVNGEKWFCSGGNRGKPPTCTNVAPIDPRVSG